MYRKAPLAENWSRLDTMASGRTDTQEFVVFTACAVLTDEHNVTHYHVGVFIMFESDREQMYQVMLQSLVEDLVGRL